MADKQSNEEHEQGEPVEVFASSNMASLAVAEAYLMEEGIPYTLHDAALQYTFPGTFAVVRILVNAEDEEIARALMLTIEDHPDSTQDENGEAAEGEENLDSTGDANAKSIDDEDKK